MFIRNLPVPQSVQPGRDGQAVFCDLAATLGRQPANSFAVGNRPYQGLLDRHQAGLHWYKNGLAWSLPIQPHAALAQQGKISVWDYTDLYVFAMAIHLGWRLEDCNVALVGAEEVFPNFATNPLGQAVANSLGQCPASPLSSYAIRLEFPLSEVFFDKAAWQLFELPQFLLKDKVRLWKLSDGRLKVWIVTRTLWEKVLEENQTFLGMKVEDKVSLRPVWQSADEELTSMRLDQTHPTGFPVRKSYLADTRSNVHPLTYYLHDAYIHATSMSMIPWQERPWHIHLGRYILQHPMAIYLPRIQKFAKHMPDFGLLFDKLDGQTVQFHPTTFPDVMTCLAFAAHHTFYEAALRNPAGSALAKLKDGIRSLFQGMVPYLEKNCPAFPEQSLRYGQINWHAEHWYSVRDCHEILRRLGGPALLTNRVSALG